MAKESSEMKEELVDRGLNGNVLVLRLEKKEVKKEEDEQQKNIGNGIEEGELVNDNTEQGNAANSVSLHPSQPSAVNVSIRRQNDQPQMSVKVETEGESMVEELQQLREAAVTNERKLKDKEMLLSMLTAKLEEVRKEKKAKEEQLMAEIGSIREETSHQCAEFERRLVEERQTIAHLTEELKLAKEKPNSMDKEMVTDMATVQSVDMVETSTTLQPTRVAIAAQLLGIDAQPWEEPQPKEWKAKFEQMNNKYLKLKKLFRAEQKVASKLRKKLHDKERDATTEELSLSLLGDADQVEPVEANEAASSPPIQSKILLSAQLRRRLMEEQVDFELPPEEEKEEEGGEVEREKEMKMGSTRRSAKATAIRGRRQLLDEGNGQKPVPAPLPLTKRMEKKNGGANTVANVSASGGVFKCQQCPPDRMAFSSAQRLAGHEKRFHGVRQQLYCRQCPDCGRRFPDNAHLESHRRTHSGEKPFKCQECGKGFTQKGGLTAHERLHTGERPYACRVCHKAFITSDHLSRHARIHSGETPFSCRHCSRQFSQTSHCREHEKICPMRAH